MKPTRGGEYLVADAAELPFEDASFDLAVAYNSLMDTDDMEGAVHEAWRVLRPGSRFCVCVTHPVNDAGRFEPDTADGVFFIDVYRGRRRYDEVWERDGVSMRFVGWCYPLESYTRALERRRVPDRGDSRAAAERRTARDQTEGGAPPADPELPDAESRQARVIELVPMTPGFIEAVLADRRGEAADLLEIELPDEFPTEGERRFLGLRLRQMHDDVRFQQWCPHAVVLDGQLIGHAGFHGPPGVNSAENPQAVEYGYTIYPGLARSRVRDGGREDADGPGRGVGRHPPLRPLRVARQRALTRHRPEVRLREDRRANGR